MRGTIRRLTRGRMVVLAVAVGLATTVAACGDDSSSSGGDESAASGGASSSQKEEAAAFVKENSGTTKFVSPGDAVDVSGYAGKSIWWVTLAYNAEPIQQTINAAKDAASRAGVDFHIVDGHAQTNNVAAGVEKAIAAGADAIVVHGQGLDLIQTAVDDAGKANIPIIGVLTNDSNNDLEKGASGNVTLDYIKQGELLAAYSVANTDGAVDAVYMGLRSVPTIETLGVGIKQGLEKFCPSGCTYKDVPTNLATMQNEIQTQVPSQLTRDPKINWMFGGFDGMAVFMVPAVTTAGKQDTVRVGSINAAPANLKFIKEGNVQAVDVGSSNGWLGWGAVDQAFRLWNGASNLKAIIPVRLFDASNVKDITDFSDDAQLYPGADYEENYLKLWTGIN